MARILIGCRMQIMLKTLPVSEVNTRLHELIMGIVERREEIVITRHGRPAAVLVSYEKYRRQRATMDVLCSPDMMKQIWQSSRFYTRGAKGLSFECVFGEPQG